MRPQILILSTAYFDAILFLLFASDLLPLKSCTSFFFFFNDTATTEIYTSVHTLSLHDALPISRRTAPGWPRTGGGCGRRRSEEHTSELQSRTLISYAVFCLKKKKNKETT